MCTIYASSEVPSVPEQPKPVGKLNRMKLFLLIVMLSVAGVVSAFGLILLYPGTTNWGMVIPLTYNFVSGEQMTYSLKINASSATPGLSQYVTENVTLRVVGFDGEYYTINATFSTSYNEGSAFTGSGSSSVVNRTGYVKVPDNVTLVGQEVSSLQGFMPAFRYDEARAGDIWQIVVGNVSISNSTLGGYAGNFTESFGKVQNLTVPAGTFRVFSMDFSGDNLSVIFPPPFYGFFAGNYSLSGRECLEYGTNRLISMEMHSTLSTLFFQQNYTTSTDTYQQIELMNYTVP